MSIGEQIKKRRKELGMSAEDLGKATGRSRATIYRLENGDTSSFTVETLEAIASALGVDLAYLLSESIQDNLKAWPESAAAIYMATDNLFEKYGALMSALDTLSKDDLKEVENFIKFKTSQSDS